MRALYWIVISLVLSLTVLGKPAKAEDRYWTIDTYRLYIESRPPMPLLVTRQPDALASIDFVEKVGGVSFESRLLASTQDYATPKLTYHPERSDGNRLTIQIAATEYNYPIYDWQLKVIADYVESSFVAIISLFGDGPDRDMNYYIQYHPAFWNNLMGVRLLQADMALMDPVGFRELPKLAGQTVLGPGEAVPAEPRSREAAEQLDQFVSDVDVDSWILTDTGNPPTLSTGVVEELIIGNPYYYFWRRGESAQETTLIAEAQAIIEQARQSGKAIPRARIEAIRRQLSTLARESRLVVGVNDATATLKTKWKTLEAYNRPVYEAAKNTYRLSGLFRAVKADAPEGWSNFYDSIKAAKTEPVPTPTRLPKG